ncbi:MAG: orotidine-5'-phosphate decarboxylase [Clostridiales bacterium]|jgi:orotidine-5'-phosphate decarboxylase|nr:orotidine-5'-phosphate decarboxylase [Clostridiales bacterium]
MIIDKLVDAIKAKRNPTALGLDTSIDCLPLNIRNKCFTPYDAARQITDHNIRLINALKYIVPAVKVQVAYYEIFGYDGMKAFSDTLEYAKACGLITIADVKRNDIGSTAEAYAQAYLSGVTLTTQEKDGAPFVSKKFTCFDSDFITVNGYLGYDGIKPFVTACRENDKGIFVLVKTSNESSGEIQDLNLRGNTGTVYRRMAKLVSEWGASLKGASAFSSVGAVVGATYPDQAEELRRAFPGMFFLIPGYGAQGGTAASLKPFFRDDGTGGIVNNSRGILKAWQNPAYQGRSVLDAAVKAAEDMAKDLRFALDL